MGFKGTEKQELSQYKESKRIQRKSANTCIGRGFAFYGKTLFKNTSFLLPFSAQGLHSTSFLPAHLFNSGTMSNISHSP